jgi:hypothetical protein
MACRALREVILNVTVKRFRIRGYEGATMSIGSLEKAQFVSEHCPDLQELKVGMSVVHTWFATSD